jgi:hypothetical protein
LDNNIPDFVSAPLAVTNRATIPYDIPNARVIRFNADDIAFIQTERRSLIVISPSGEATH